MRWTEINEAASPATLGRIGKAKHFLKKKWAERAAELGRPAPTDLSSACKFGALFAKALFGGDIKANDFHTWVDLDGKIIDLTDESEEVSYMKRGVVPPSQEAYAKAYGLTIPETGIYTPDPSFMKDRDFKDSLKSCMPRIKQWVKEFNIEYDLREKLEQMDVDDLDRMAYGHVSGDIIKLSPDQIKIIWPGDLENPEYKFKQGGMNWVNSVDFSEPIEVSINQDGEYQLEDGHHRWFAAKKLGRDLDAVLEIKGKPIERILQIKKTKG